MSSFDLGYQAATLGKPKHPPQQLDKAEQDEWLRGYATYMHNFNHKMSFIRLKSWSEQQGHKEQIIGVFDTEFDAKAKLDEFRHAHPMTMRHGSLNGNMLTLYNVNDIGWRIFIIEE